MVGPTRGGYRSGTSDAQGRRYAVFFADEPAYLLWSSPAIGETAGSSPSYHHVRAVRGPVVLLPAGPSSGDGSP